MSGALPRSPRRPPLLSLLALLLALLAGCASSLQTGPVERPEIYPDRTEADVAFATFLWAWNAGDVDVLLQVLGGWLHHDLRAQVEKNGREATSEHYRGAGDLVLVEYEWTQRSEYLAYLRVVLKSSSVERTEQDFSLLQRPDGWVVTGQRLLR